MSSVLASPAIAAQPHPTPGEMVVNGLKAIGEVTVAPGSSLIIDGDIKSGALHLVGGLLAKWALGPIGVIVVATNSYSKSVTGKSLFQHLSSARHAVPPPPATTTV
jgi:ethanolamine utilization microcompartment shell protein EutS